jgi:hypothetical protein
LLAATVDAATNGDRILILPGVYREEPSRRVTRTPKRCEGMTTGGETIPGTGIGLTGEEQTPTYEFHRACPNVQNLIAIMGDADLQPNPHQPPSDPDGRWCDDKCDLQIEGTGDTRDDVLIQGDKHKLNVIRADRADGIYLRNFTIEFSDFNNIYALETNGFRFDDIESRYSREYGLLSFTSDNGLYENLEAHHAGDSGVYPGSGPEGHCDRYGIEIRNVDSHDNTIGWSGTAGNGVWTHDSSFHHNSTGITMDSFASGHPGMPQDCSKFEGNRIYSNNLDLFNDERDDYCRETPYRARPRQGVPDLPGARGHRPPDRRAASTSGETRRTAMRARPAASRPAIPPSCPRAPASASSFRATPPSRRARPRARRGTPRMRRPTARFPAATASPTLSEPQPQPAAAGVTPPVEALGGDDPDGRTWPALLLIAGAGIMSAGLVLRRYERP